MDGYAFAMMILEWLPMEFDELASLHVKQMRSYYSII